MLKALKTVATTEQKKRVALGALDAFVRLDAELPLEEIVPWFQDPELRIPALILASRRPKECARFLLSSLQKEESHLIWQAMINLVLEADPQAFVRQAVQEIRFRIVVSVSDPQTPRPICCGGFFGRFRLRTETELGEWPPTPRYFLTADPGELELEKACFAPGPCLVSFLRSDRPDIFEGFLDSTPSSRDAASRQAYQFECLRSLAGLDDHAILRSPSHLSHTWKNSETYLASIEEHVAEVQRGWSILLNCLARGRWLPRDAAKQAALPVDVGVDDDRGNKQTPIPEVPSKTVTWIDVERTAPPSSLLVAFTLHSPIPFPVPKRSTTRPRPRLRRCTRRRRSQQ